jgi:hypothetical protein
MKRLLLFLALCSSAHAVTYISQSGGSVSCPPNSTQSTTAIGSVTWASGTYQICGTLTTAPNINANNVTITFSTGAAINASCHAATRNSCFSGTGISGLLVDGNPTTGGSPCGWVNQVLVACNGTVEASDPTQTAASAFGIDASSCTNCEFRNLNIGPIYNAVANGTQPGGDIRGIQVLPSSGSGTILIHNNIVHDTSSGLVYVPNGSNDNGYSDYNNYVYNVNSCQDVSNNNNGTITGLFHHDNFCGSTANWDTAGCANHHNSFHIFGFTTGNSNIRVYNNTVSGNWGACPTGVLFFDATNPPGSSNCIVFNNVMQTTYTNTSGGNPITGNCSGTNYFFNNTYLGDSGSGDLCLNVGSTVTNAWTIENNAIGNCNSELFATNSLGSVFALIDYNFWEGSTSSTPWGVNCSSGCSPYYTFATWQSGGGHDTHGAYNTSTGYFNISASGVPQVGSPLINAGINLTSLCASFSIPGNPCNLDAFGNARPASGLWTVGALNSSMAPPVNPVVLIQGSVKVKGNVTIN